MAYCTLEDVQQAAGGAKRLRELSDFEGKGAIDLGVVNRAIAKADAEINTRLQGRYGVDLADPPPRVIAHISADEAVFSMKESRGMASEVDLARHVERIEQLKEFAKGDASLGTTPEPTRSELQRYDSTDGQDAARNALKGGFC